VTSSHLTSPTGLHEEMIVILFYKYVHVSDPLILADKIRNAALLHSLTGRVIVAEEGLNGTLEGDENQVSAFRDFILSDERFHDMHIKESAGNGESFPKLTVKVKKEIVSTGFSKEEADPTVRTGTRLSPEDLRAWYESGKEFTVIDMRNNYEFASGHFRNSIHPNISASRHLPLALEKLEQHKDSPVLTVCTGGVRCEKMSAYLMSHGFSNVHQLDGGIHSYMEKYPGQDFKGTLYTFDRRLTMHFGGDREIVGACALCGTRTEQYVDCAEDTCHYHFLACGNCVDERGRAFCSDVCRADASRIVATASGTMSAL
jgi:UPF0176 protein